jgi:hypothetical protein
MTVLPVDAISSRARGSVKALAGIGSGTGRRGKSYGQVAFDDAAETAGIQPGWLRGVWARRRGSSGGCLGADLWETEAMRSIRVYLRWLAGATLLLGAVLVNREKNGEDLMAEQA